MKARTTLKICSLIFIMASFTPIANAQRSFLDSAFGSNGVLISNFSSRGQVNSLAIQPDHKILAAGNANGCILMRLLENGNYDSSFAINGLFAGPYGSGNTVLLQPDNKILLLCSGIILRLNANGSLDHTFGRNGIDSTLNFWPEISGNAMALLPGGKIVIAGSANSTSMGIGRLMPDGSPDSSFGSNGAVVTSTWATWAWGDAVGVAVMPDGRIVAGGESNFGIIAIRLLSGGAPDTSFNHTGVALTQLGNNFDYCHSVKLQPDGKLVLAGGGVFGSDGEDFYLVRYNTDGSIDRSYGDTGVAIIDFNGKDDECLAMYPLPNGKIAATGYAIIDSVENFALTFIDSNGHLDSGLGNSGKIYTSIQAGNDRALAVTMQQDGKIICAGYSDIGTFPSNFPDITLARYFPSMTEGIKPVNGAASQYPELYPNPTKNKLFISNNNNDKIEKIIAYNIAGQDMDIPTLINNNEISVEGLPTGMYFFKIYLRYQPPVIQKILIQK
jgi:uncharacterized delta-60 repeat protein